MIIVGVSERQMFGTETRGICRHFLLYICPFLDDKADNDENDYHPTLLPYHSLRIEINKRQPVSCPVTFLKAKYTPKMVRIVFQHLVYSLILSFYTSLIEKLISTIMIMLCGTKLQQYIHH